MKHLLTTVALVALSLTVVSCHQKDEPPLSEPERIERPARISAPFIGQVYTEVQADTDGVTQFSYFLELKDDGTVDYKRYRGAADPEVITGKYTYDAETKKITFSDLSSSVTGAKTPESLYLENAIYDEVRDQITFRNGKDASDVYFYAVNLKNSVPAPFVGKPYIGYIIDSLGKRADYSLTFYPNKTIYGQQRANGSTKVLTGNYSYNLRSGDFSFSNLALDGQATTAKDLALDKNSSYTSTQTSSTLLLGGYTFIVATQGVNAPFTGQAYAISYESEDQTIVYRREVTFELNGTFLGINYQNGGETGRFVGNYTYDATTGALTLSNLKAGDSDATADGLYLNQNPRYDKDANAFVLGGATYRLSSQVPKAQPTNPPAFYDKVYSDTWESGGQTYKETFQLMANGVVHYRYLVDGKESYGFNGRYTYNATTHAIVLHSLLDLEYKIVSEADIAHFNEGAAYYPATNQLYIQKATYSLEN